MINIRAWDIRKQIGKCCFNNQVIIGNDKDSDITVILYMNPRDFSRATLCSKGKKSYK